MPGDPLWVPGRSTKRVHLFLPRTDSGGSGGAGAPEEELQRMIHDVDLDDSGGLDFEVRDLFKLKIHYSTLFTPSIPDIVFSDLAPT